MARPLRIAFENAFYHIIARGIRKENIFLSERDKYVFLEKVNETFEKYSFICHAYCLMNNHYHLFIQTPLGNISDGMHYLNASYANWFRAKYNLVGPIFQGRYKSILVDAENYALTLSAYIHLNPIKAGIVNNLYQYKFSSFLAYVGKQNSPIKTLDTSLILGILDEDIQKARNKYAKYILKVDFSEIQNAKGEILGSENFVKRIKKMLEGKNDREIPYTKKLNRISYDLIIDCMKKNFNIDKSTIFSKKRGNVYRKIALFLIKRYTDLSLSEIGKLFDMDYAAVSQMCRRFKEEIAKDEKLKKMVDIVSKVIEERADKL